MEGLGLYINGTDLAPEVYRDNDINELIDTLMDQIKPHGEMQGFWQGPRETALYFYGESAQQMQAAMAEVIAVHPLCQQSRLVQIA